MPTQRKRSGLRRRRRRFFRWVYATLSLFAMFAVVAGFFNLNKRGESTSSSGSTSSTGSTSSSGSSGSLTGNAANDAELLIWIYWLYPSPMAFSWILVYSGRHFTCRHDEGLHKTSNYHFNLLVACLVAAAFYTFLIECVIGFSFASGPNLGSAIIMAVCSFGLVLLQMVDEASRRRRKRDTVITLDSNEVELQDIQELDETREPTHNRGGGFV